MDASFGTPSPDVESFHEMWRDIAAGVLPEGKDAT